MKYYIIAGERSGDLHAANLISCLKNEDLAAEFRGMGGDYMEAEGCRLEAHYREMALMGFLEVLVHFRRVFKYLKKIKADILTYQPDVLILVDFGGFNMKMARFATVKGIPVHYYIAPKVWAWNQKRAYRLKENIDKLYTILPFEPDFFKKFDWEVDYVGNPLLDEKRKFQPDPEFLSKFNLQAKQLIALLPGSREQEVKQMLQTMTALKDSFEGVEWVVAGVKNLSETCYREAVDAGLKVVYDRTYDVLHHARAAVVTSGTATLETALFKVPQVVVYKTSGISYAIAKRLIRVPFISLVNLIAGKEVVKELIQDSYNPEAVKSALQILLSDGPGREGVLAGYSVIIDRIGQKKASRETARLIYNTVKGKLQ